MGKSGLFNVRYTGDIFYEQEAGATRPFQLDRSAKLHTEFKFDIPFTDKGIATNGRK